jgi:thiamine phosphate synthase YjbQ (UPF0047 family)
MIVATARLDIATDEGASLSDVTGDVNAFLKTSGIVNGLCVLSTTAEGSCLTLSAELDEDVDDLLRLAWTHLSGPALDRSENEEDFVAPERPDRIDVDGAGYAPAGVLADSVSFPVRDGAVALGTWEAIVLLDARGPAVRPVDVTVIGR